MGSLTSLCETHLFSMLIIAISLHKKCSSPYWKPGISTTNIELCVFYLNLAFKYKKSKFEWPLHLNNVLFMYPTIIFCIKTKPFNKHYHSLSLIVSQLNKHMNIALFVTEISKYILVIFIFHQKNCWASMSYFYNGKYFSRPIWHVVFIEYSS